MIIRLLLSKKTTIKVVKCRKILPRYLFLFNGRQRNHYIVYMNICKYVMNILALLSKIIKKFG